MAASRPRLKPLFPIALSAEALAESLGVRVSTIRRAIEADELPLYIPNRGARRPRILVEDAVAYVRKHWKRKTP